MTQTLHLLFPWLQIIQAPEIPLGVPCEEIIVNFAMWLVYGVQVHLKVSAEGWGVR